MSLNVTVTHVRELLTTGNEQPVLYVNVADGPAHVDVWAGAYVPHHQVIASREEITDQLGDEPSDSDIRDILEGLQEEADRIMAEG